MTTRIMLQRLIEKLIEDSDLILDVGSGDRPLRCAHVLCDLHPKNSSQRAWNRPLNTLGKPFILCDGQFLPFRDKAFGFVNARHVLEHADNPRRFFAELSRVGRSGYVETPTWFSENIVYGWGYHKWTLRTKKEKLSYQRPRRLKIYNHQVIPFGYIFHPMYSKSSIWRFIHHLLDRYLGVFTVKYFFAPILGYRLDKAFDQKGA